MENRVLTLLGFAAKAGKLSFGMDASVKSVIAGKSKLIVTARDVSAKSFKEILFHSQKKDVKVMSLDGFDKKTVSDAVGRKCGIISVNDSGFADALIGANAEGGNANDK